MNTDIASSNTDVVQIQNGLAEPFTINLTNPFTYASASLQNLPYSLITLQTTAGVKGFGEAAVAWDINGESQGGAVEMFNVYIKPLLIGKEITTLRDIEDIMQLVNRTIFGNPALKAAVEMALLDVLGKKDGKPVHAYFPGSPKKNIVFQEVFPFEEITGERFREILQVVLQNSQVTTIKFKARSDITELLSPLKIAAQEAPHLRVVLDANQSWKNVTHAGKNIRQLRDQGVNLAWIEQPLPQGDTEGLQSLVADKSMAPALIMVDESCHDLQDLTNLYEKKAMDIINIKLAKCGGLLEAKRMIEYCDEKKIPYMLGDMLHSSLGTAANLHAATLGNFISYDITHPSKIKDDPFTGLSYDGFTVAVPQLPGLGVHPKAAE